MLIRNKMIQPVGNRQSIPTGQMGKILVFCRFIVHGNFPRDYLFAFHPIIQKWKMSIGG
jgi:hypothetical protein